MTEPSDRDPICPGRASNTDVVELRCRQQLTDWLFHRNLLASTEERGLGFSYAT